MIEHGRFEACQKLLGVGTNWTEGGAREGHGIRELCKQRSTETV